MQVSRFRKLLIFGGADRDRTDDLLNAIQALSQLSYGPTRTMQERKRRIIFAANRLAILVISINDLQKSNQQFANFSNRNHDFSSTFYDRVFGVASINSSACRRVRSVILTPPSIRATSETLSGSERRST
jgi:hypothetical protein